MGHCVPRAGPSPAASVLLKGKVRSYDQAKPIKQPALLLPGSLTVLSLNYRVGEKSALNSWGRPYPDVNRRPQLIEKNISVYSYESIAIMLLYNTGQRFQLACFIFQSTNCFTEPSSWYAVPCVRQAARGWLWQILPVSNKSSHLYPLSTKCLCTTFIRSSEPQHTPISLL